MNRKSVFRVGIFLAFFVGFTAFYANAQGIKTRIDHERLVEVDVMPEFPGGTDSLMKFLQDSLVYPFKAQVKGREGVVVIGFIVEQDGRLTNFTVDKSSGYPLLDDEALRVVKLMPNWSPGKQNGKYVRVRFRLPVNFSLKNR